MQNFTPRLFQVITIAELLEHLRYNVWMPPGMGKTSATLMALDMASLTDSDVFPALVLASYRIAQEVWPGEVEKWRQLSHLRVSPVLGNEQRRIRALGIDADIYSINYENLPWLVEYYGGTWPFKTVIADESTRLKGYRSRQGSARARAIATHAFGKVKRFINLTGTPSPNGLKDLWGQNWFIDKGERLGRTHTAFSQRWFQKSWDGYGIEPLAHADKEIKSKLKDVTISLDPKDYFDLREPIERTIEFELPLHIRKMYNEMEKEFFVKIDGHEIEAFNAAGKTNKLLQLCNGALYIEPDSENSNQKVKDWKVVHDLKIEALDSLAEELSGASLLVPYYFKSDVARLIKAFPKAKVLDKDSKTLRDWNKGRIPMLFAHPASAGHGLSLQDGGHHLAFFGHTWDLELYMQIIERIGPVRQLQSGYNRNVFIYHIIAKNTIEEDVLERLTQKYSVQEALLKAMKRRKT